MRERGDISRGAESTGAIWRGNDTQPENTIKEPPKGLLGDIVVDTSGSGAAFLGSDIRIWEVIGRGMIVALKGVDDVRSGEEVVGVIARSAGVWDNEKTVCSCSGKTVWEERREQVARGML